MHPKTLFLALLTALPLACSDSPPRSAAPTSDLPASYHLASEPPGALSVIEVHKNAKDGDAVVVVGDVGGSATPFVSGAAAFTLVDSSMKSCVNDGMNCATPWDYCCEDPAAMQLATATIEFRAGDAVISASPRGFHGLDHLKRVVVKGTAKRDAQGNLTIVAEGVHVRG